MQEKGAETRKASIDPKRLRSRMVREQLEARGISDARVLDAMWRVPRHMFVPEGLAPHAYDDSSLPIGYGQTISQPYTVARMSELLKIEPGMRVLEIGAGSGYQAAVLAAMGCTVYAIERLRELFIATTAKLRKMGLRTIHLKCGDGTLGLAHAAPFHRIIVSAGGPEIPPPLVEQLRDDGILLIPVGARQREQRLVRLRRIHGRIVQEDLGPAVFVDLVGNHGWR